MKKKIGIISAITAIVIIGVILLIVLLGGKEESYRYIKINNLEGNITITRNEEIIEARSQMNLRSNDDILVGDDSSMIIQLDNDKFIFLKENSHISLVSSEKDSSLTRIILYEGTIITEVKEKLNDDVFDVETPNSVMSIRGTIVSASVTDNNNQKEVEFNLVEGEVSVVVIQPANDVNNVGQFPLSAGNGVKITIDNNSLVNPDDVHGVVNDSQVDNYDSFDDFISYNGEVDIFENELSSDEIDDILYETYPFNHSQNQIGVVSIGCMFSVNSSSELYYSYEALESYTIKVVPQEKPGYVFEHFLVNDVVVNQSILEIEITEKTLIEAVYKKIDKAMLNITIEGGIDSAYVAIEGDLELEDEFNVGQVVNLTINSNAETINFEVIGWYKNGELISKEFNIEYEVDTVNNLVVKIKPIVYDITVSGGESGLEFYDGFASVLKGSSIDLSKIVVEEFNSIGSVILSSEDYIIDSSNVDFNVVGEYTITITHKANPDIEVTLYINVIEDETELFVNLFPFGDVNPSGVNIMINSENYGEFGHVSLANNEEVLLTIQDTDNAAFLGWAYFIDDDYEIISRDYQYRYVHGGFERTIYGLLGYKQINVSIQMPENAGTLKVTHSDEIIESTTNLYEKEIFYGESISFEFIPNEGLEFVGWKSVYNDDIISTEILTITPDAENQNIIYEPVIKYNYDYIELDGTNTVFTEFLEGSINVGDEFDYSNLIIYGYVGNVCNQLSFDEVELSIWLEAEDMIKVDIVDTSFVGNYIFDFKYTNPNGNEIYASAFLRVVLPAPEFFIEFGLDVDSEDASNGFKVIKDTESEYSRTVPVRNGVKYQDPYSEEVYEEVYEKGVGFDHNLDLGETPEGNDFSYLKYYFYQDLITTNEDGSYNLNMSVLIPEGYHLYTGTNLNIEGEEIYYGSYEFTKVDPSNSITDYIDWKLDGQEFYHSYKTIMFMVVHESINPDDIGEHLIWEYYRYENQVYAINVSIDMSEFNFSFNKYLNTIDSIPLSDKFEEGAAGNSDGVRYVDNLSDVETYTGRVYNPHLNDDGSITFGFENFLGKTISYINNSGDYIESNDLYNEITLMATECYVNNDKTLKTYRIFYYFEYDGNTFAIAIDLVYPGICEDYGYNFCDDHVISGEWPYCMYHYYNEKAEQIFNYYFGENGIFASSLAQ